MSKNIWENVSNIKKSIFSTYNDQKSLKKDELVNENEI